MMSEADSADLITPMMITKVETKDQAEESTLGPTMFYELTVLSNLKDS